MRTKEARGMGSEGDQEWSKHMKWHIFMHNSKGHLTR